MIVKHICAVALIVGACPLLPAAARAQSAPDAERIAASFVLALGRMPTATEAREWASADPRPVADLLGRHREALRHDAVAGRAVAVKAGQDAFGRAPSEDELLRLSDGEIYAEIVQRHLQRLVDSKEEYERVVHRAYRLHLQRDAYRR